VLLLFVISLGCGHSFLPYCYLYNFWPFKGIAEMARFYVVLYLFFSIGVIQAIRKLSTYSKWFLPAIFIFIIFERIPSGFYLSDSPQNETFIKIVRNLNSNAVLDLPIINEWENTPQKTDYDLYSIFYQKPIVNGAFQWLGYTEKSESFINKLMYFECKTSPIITDIDITKTIMPALNENGIKTLVYHKQLKVTDQKSGWCNQAIDNINFFLYKSDLSIKKAYEDDQTVVYQLQ
jgi:hypothetical protein